MKNVFGIVDLFAGPGGLGEGFCSLKRDKTNAFEIDVSVEKDAVAHSTLRLRSFLRKFNGGLPKQYLDFLYGKIEEPDWSRLYPLQWAQAVRETLYLTLGEPKTTEILEERIWEIRQRRGDRLILIGGPPCQAYSLAGRGRKPSDLGYVAHEENRHLLYKEYICVLRSLRPAAFVMENVKGMLSSSIERGMVFDLLKADLENQGGTTQYALFPLSTSIEQGRDARPQDFIVTAEHHGVPQARHRVIIVGFRRDLLKELDDFMPPKLREFAYKATVRDVLSEMPVLRSGISSRGGRKDDPKVWRRTVQDAAKHIKEMSISLTGDQRTRYLAMLREISELSIEYGKLRNNSTGGTRLPSNCPIDLRAWLEDERFERLSLHETRGHMPDDLKRYMFAACWAMATGNSPKARDFPDELAPNHTNWKSGKFNDRFRAQPWEMPSSTVTCHLAKDGHYFIHPDPAQCRSMTVREAARLQTFPDNYYFKGNRTQQYIQVGNAVPPFLAHQIARTLHDALLQIFPDITLYQPVPRKENILA
ncbi:MAG: DNA cytosine methyltransferase [Aestuariivita sp.]|nr:DNA cytosine methyltransferase [Aestuariivita sp.]